MRYVGEGASRNPAQFVAWLLNSTFRRCTKRICDGSRVPHRPWTKSTPDTLFSYAVLGTVGSSVGSSTRLFNLNTDEAQPRWFEQSSYNSTGDVSNIIISISNSTNLHLILGFSTYQNLTRRRAKRLSAHVLGGYCLGWCLSPWQWLRWHTLSTTAMRG